MNPFDFDADLRKELKAAANLIGFRLSDKIGLDKMLVNYLTVRAKIINPKPRQVLISPLLQWELRNHTKRKEIEFIIAAASGGRNLNCFQSNKLVQANFHDHLQNEWRIFHFHLSLKKEKHSNFVQQGDTILFAFVEEKHIVFLGTDTHREGVFGDKKWFEILHTFFPDLICKYRVNSAISAQPDMNAQERQNLWNFGWTTGVIDVGGVVCYSPGLGRMSTGHSINVVRSADDIFMWIHKLQEQVAGSYESLCNYLNVAMVDAEFKIRFGEQTLELYEVQSGKKLLSFPQVFQETVEQL